MHADLNIVSCLSDLHPNAVAAVCLNCKFWDEETSSTFTHGASWVVIFSVISRHLALLSGYCAFMNRTRFGAVIACYACILMYCAELYCA